MDYTDPGYVARRFGVSIEALHESAHACAAVLLGLPLVAVVAKADGESLTAVLHVSTDPDHVRRLAAVYAVTPVLFRERFRMQALECRDDVDNYTVLEWDYTRQTSRHMSAVALARQVIADPKFSAGMDRLMHTLHERGELTGDQVRELMGGLAGSVTLN